MMLLFVFSDGDDAFVNFVFCLGEYEKKPLSSSYLASSTFKSFFKYFQVSCVGVRLLSTSTPFTYYPYTPFTTSCT